MSVYYNEIDPFCCEWLRNNMRAGLIPEGDVDGRSIADVEPDDLIGYDQCHFFAGIGIWAFALQRSGWGDRPVWTGSCPCQPFSVAGAQKGFDDKRHLWPEFRRLIAERHPPTVFGEQVAGASPWLRIVRSDLEEMDYAMGAIPIEAASAAADHFRDRYWFVADTCGSQRREKPKGRCDESGWPDAGRKETAGGYELGGQASSDLRPMADDDSQRPQIALSQSSDVGSECAAAAGDRVRDVVDMPSERGDWGANTPEQARWFSAQIADCGGLYYIECPDGKWRRLPPPRVRWLGTRIPARTAKLRAIGNAIDPRPAEAFIRAYLETGRVHAA